MNTTKLYLIRHGESEQNLTPHIIVGRNNTENPLTCRGIAQARNLGRHMLAGNIIPTKVYASPADRTVETAEHVLRAMGQPQEVIVADELQEMCQGDWTSRHRGETYTSDVIAEIGVLGKDFKAPNGESMNEVGDRMLRWVESIMTSSESSEEPDQIFAFSHAMAICSLAAKLRGWTQPEARYANIPNASYSVFTPNNGLWQLDEIGLVAADSYPPRST